MRTPSLFGSVCIALACAAVYVQAEETVVDQARAKYKAEAELLCAELIKDLGPEERANFEKAFQAKGNALAPKLAATCLPNFDEVFTLPEALAQTVLAGQFDDEGNTKLVRLALNQIAERKLRMTIVGAHLTACFNRGDLKGLKLDFAVRYFNAVLNAPKK